MSTTRVYKYGAVPLEQFPKVRMDELFRANALWNRLVELHNEHSIIYDQARRDEDEEYSILSQAFEDLEEKIKKAFSRKRTARMKAGTRDASHSLIKRANDPGLQISSGPILTFYLRAVGQIFSSFQLSRMLSFRQKLLSIPLVNHYVRQELQHLCFLAIVTALRQILPNPLYNLLRTK